MTAKTVAVVGAGMGGLTAALALIKKGFDVSVYEQASELREVGAGVQLGPNAMRVYAALGLDAVISRFSFVPDAHAVRSWKTGAVISSTRMKGIYEKRYGIGYHAMLRADLQNALAAALPSGALHLGKKCAGVENRTGSVTLRFDDGSSVDADVVVGADGIHSVIRESLLGPDKPRFTGMVAYRGTVPIASLPEGLLGPDITVYIGPHASVVYYCIRPGELVSWVALVEEDSWRRESWSEEGDVNALMRRYEGWCPVVNEIFSRAEHCFKWALFGRAPLPRWTSGRVAILGDAAHPMLPYLAQGACMAIEDGYVLADELAKLPDEPEKGLRQYEAARLPRASRVQLMSRERARINQLPSLPARVARNIRFIVDKLIDPERHTYKIEWIYGYDVTR